MNRLFITIVSLAFFVGSVQAMELSTEERNALGEKLLVAVFMGDQPLVEAFIIKGADVNFICPRGRFPLRVAASGNNFEICQLLLASGADVNQCNNEKGTALMNAVNYGGPKVCNLFLQSGADVNAKDNYGNTAFTLPTNALIPVESALEIYELLVEKMMSALPTEAQKNRWNATLICFKRMHPIDYPHLRNIFKSYFYAMTKEENRANVHAQVKRFGGSCLIGVVMRERLIKQHLLEKYFSGVNQ